MIEISIVIPFKNHFQQLEKCIVGILNQEIECNFEVIVLDSSEKLFEKSIVNLSSQITYVRIDPNTFNHGNTRQSALKFCRGKFVVFTVQDAVPLGRCWLKNLIQPIIDNELDAICGQQVVMEDESKNPVQWFRPIDQPSIEVIEISSERYIQMSPTEKRKLTGWDNVNACYRKEILEKLPFANLNFGEDAFWADQALKNGLKIGYTGHAQVNHYHHYDQIQQIVRRVIAENLILKKTYDLNPSPYRINLRSFISIVKRIILSKIKIFDKFYWIIYNIRIEFAYKQAYVTWCSFASLNHAEEYVNKKVPQSIKNGRN